MKKIVLLCAQGMSTGVMVNRMRAAAKEEGYECTINAYPKAQAAEVGVDADCILLGPQVRFEKADIQEAVPNVPVDIIDMKTYGRLDGVKALDQAKKLMTD
ncbi:MAG: PTS sugar transporter subunit IIB [Lachnospiraceae bacterium]|nr:PTS sugar transporter subunit IIB [Lachnospiraceae bacterium]